MDAADRARKIGELESLRREFESLPTGPPFVKCVVVEWPEKRGRRSDSIFGSHPSCQSGTLLKTSWLATPGPSDEGKPLPAKPRFSEGWAFKVGWFIDSADSMGATEYRERISHLNRRICDVLLGLSALAWSQDISPTYHELRLLSEIVVRLRPRRHIIAASQATTKFLGVTSSAGSPAAVKTPRVFTTWIEKNRVFDPADCAFRSWTIDNFALSALSVIDQLCGELASDDGLDGSASDSLPPADAPEPAPHDTDNSLSWYEPGHFWFNGEKRDLKPKPLSFLVNLVDSRKGYLEISEIKELIGQDPDAVASTTRTHVSTARAAIKAAIEGDAGITLDNCNDPIPHKDGAYRLGVPKKYFSRQKIGGN